MLFKLYIYKNSGASCPGIFSLVLLNLYEYLSFPVSQNTEYRK